MRRYTKEIIKEWLTIISIFLIVLIIIVVIWFLLQGETKVTGEWPGADTSESLSCKANNISYKFYKTDNSYNSNTQINIIFNNKKASSISLIHETIFPNDETAEKYYDIYSFNTNDDIAKSNIKANALNTNFYVDKNNLRMSLYATDENINNVTSKYFLLNTLPRDIEDYSKKYTEQGFDCIMTKQE